MNIFSIGDQTVAIAPELVTFGKWYLLFCGAFGLVVLAFIVFVALRVFRGFRDFDKASGRSIRRGR